MEMDAATPPPIAPVYRDRRTGLIFFGVCAILIGTFFALLVPVAFFGQAMAARREGADFNVPTAVIGSFVYGLMAVVLIWLGVGSILMRRWARALLLCIGWIGLVIGVIAMPAVWVAMNSIGDTLRAQGQTVSPAQLAVVKGVALSVTFVIYIVIPGIAVLFYRSPHVRHTCELRDPVARWTDRCPLPVLALCLLQGFTVPMVLLTIPVYGGAFPLAGFVMQGWTARLLWLVVAVFLAYSARGFYRLELRAWWVYTIGAVVMWASSLATFLRIDLIEFYRLMGLPERQLERMANNPLLAHGTLLWLSGLGALAFLCYLLYVRRFFAPVTDRPPVVAG